MKKTIDYERIPIKQGIELHLLPTSKFKTTVMKVYIQERLRKKTAPMVALISYLLFRGTKKRPTTIEIMRYLEELYGANFTTDVDKWGECQFLTLSLEIINKHYLPGGKDILNEGLDFLMEVLTEPLAVENGFKPEYFEQEKMVLKEDIKSLFNDKSKYAYERCKQIMFAEEPFGIYKYGDLEALEKVNNEELYSYYKQLLENNPIHIFIVGDLDRDKIVKQIEETFAQFKPRKTSFEPVIPYDKKTTLKKVVEKENIRQGKLCIGYRTNSTIRSPLYLPLLLFNGIFGGSPHSKLFQNIREKAGLAYYIYSSLESTKGIIMLESGIEFSALDRVLNIIDEQLRELKKGNVSQEELDYTIKAYSRYFRYITDDQENLIETCLLDITNGLEPGFDRYVNELQTVTIEDIQEVAQKVEPDTIYFLQGREEAEVQDDNKEEF